ncbi:inositol-3-phosphate synthase [Nonomuraea sp. NPDC004297]
MKTLNVALAGVGSCASSLIQLTELASQTEMPLAGVVHERIGGYRLRDLRFVAAFDVDARKIDLDLAKAITVHPTAAVMRTQVLSLGTIVEAGPVLDGIDGNLIGVVTPHQKCENITIDQVRRRLVETSANVMVCLLPAGATEAVQAYARAAALSGVAFINATPDPVAHEPELTTLFEDRRVPLLGDDLRSHLGATTLHTALIELLHSRGLTITNTYQLNVGGNTDFLNLSDPRRAAHKVRTKRNALQAAGIDAENVSAGPSGFIEYLGDTKTCFIRIEANSVLDSPLSLDIRLQVEDSPNAAGVLASAVRLAAAAADQGRGGVIDEGCPYLFKSPRHGATALAGLRMFEDYVQGVATAE